MGGQVHLRKMGWGSREVPRLQPRSPCPTLPAGLRLPETEQVRAGGGAVPGDPQQGGPAATAG